MALLTKSRTESAVSTWESIFPNPTLGIQQSTIFVKKLLAIAISNIAYLRTMFPEGAFGDKKLENMNLKVLREDGRCPGAYQLIQWVKGCFDALDRKYLRTIVLGIYLDPSDSRTALETYTFRFSYAQSADIDIYRNDRKISSSSHLSQCDDVKRATIKLLRSILVLTQTLDPLPNDVYMTLKLFYYDDVTPLDYQPDGFRSSGEGNFVFRDESFLIDVGQVETFFHNFQVRVKALCSNFDDAQVESAETPQAQKLDTPASSQMCPSQVCPSQMCPSQMCPSQMCPSQMCPSQMCPSQMDTACSPQHPPRDSGGEFRCPCGMGEGEGEEGLERILCCHVCNTRQHSVCFGILATTDHVKHVCEQCSCESYPPTDPMLSSLTEGERKRLSLWRRCLLACSAMSTITQNSLTRKLQVSPAEAGELIQRLRREELISAVGKSKKPVRFSPTPLLHATGMAKYFLPQRQVGESASSDLNKLNKRKLSADKDLGGANAEQRMKKRKSSKCLEPISTSKL